MPPLKGTRHDTWSRRCRRTHRPRRLRFDRKRKFSPAPLKAKAKAKVCVGGQKYSAKRCGGPKKNIPSYCLDGKRVAGGYLIKNGGCYQNNGGGE